MDRHWEKPHNWPYNIQLLGGSCGSEMEITCHLNQHYVMTWADYGNVDCHHLRVRSSTSSTSQSLVTTSSPRASPLIPYNTITSAPTWYY
jgi:hypothetical protein